MSYAFVKPEQVMLICFFKPKESKGGAQIMSEYWRIAEKGIKAEKDSLVGYPTIQKIVEAVRRQMDETIFHDIQRMALIYCLPLLSKTNVYYTIVSYGNSTQTESVYGVGYVIRQTPIGKSEVRRHGGVVLRCARCGEAPAFATKTDSSVYEMYRNDDNFHIIETGVMNARLGPNKIAGFFLCGLCHARVSASLNAINHTIATCWCGYRFLTGWAEWYFDHKDAANCPNCGITLAGSGTAVVGIGDVQYL